MSVGFEGYWATTLWIVCQKPGPAVSLSCGYLSSLGSVITSFCSCVSCCWLNEIYYTQYLLKQLKISRKEYMRLYNQINKERIYSVKRKWDEKNRDKVLSSKKKYKKNHQEAVNKWNEITNKYKIKFCGKTIYIGFRQQTGHCTKCPRNIYDGSCKQTDMHHYFYCVIMPWACRVELCDKCHGHLSYETMKGKNCGE